MSKWDRPCTTPVRRQTVAPKTDLTRWRLTVADGRQYWTYLDDDSDERLAEAVPLSTRYHLGIGDGVLIGEAREDRPDVAPTVDEAMESGVGFFAALQTDDGHWAGDYGGPMFLLPGLAIVEHVTGGLQLGEARRAEISRYLLNMQADDGGWGIHIESESTVFGTVLTYVALRLFGLAADNERAKRARAWIQEHGGAIHIPSWGKFWLSVANLYSWDGSNSLFPEMNLLPRWAPLHPCKLWSYTRTVYMPMSYLQALRFQAPLSDLIMELRSEIYCAPYDTIDWASTRNLVHKIDLYRPTSLVFRSVQHILNAYEHYVVGRVPFLRNRSLRWLEEILDAEDRFTKFLDIGPVSKAMHVLIAFVRHGAASHEFRQHVDRVKDYLWMGRDGMKMNGTNGSQLWDTAFALQAAACLPESLRKRHAPVLARAARFVDHMQIRTDHPDHDRYYRDRCQGGWPFSTRDIGWPVADCTAEGLKASLVSTRYGMTDAPLSQERLEDAVDRLLAYQSSNGGYATCERMRGAPWFELFNASEVFGDIMIDYTYVECTSAVVQSLCYFRSMHETYRRREMDACVGKAVAHVRSLQRTDGSWEGLWGVCFTYATWFGVAALASAGVDVRRDEAVERACAFLVAHEHPEGGWGESFLSCVTREYVSTDHPMVVNTAWALLTLLDAQSTHTDVIERAVRVLLRRQLCSGDWAEENIMGVFNKNCMISYSNYKNIFPLWALARYRQCYPNSEL